MFRHTLAQAEPGTDGAALLGLDRFASGA